LKLYALLREDLQMPTGKAATQTGHAFIGSYLSAPKERQEDYHHDGIGTKICLSVSGLEDLLHWQHRARTQGLPNFLVEDTGRNTTFGGIPTVSALGIGPLNAAEAKSLRKLQLMQ